MLDTPLPILIALELTLLLNLILGGALWFTFRELKKARKRFMQARREASKLKRQAPTGAEEQATSLTLSDFLKQQLSATDDYLASLQEQQDDESEETSFDIETVDESAPSNLKLLALKRHFIEQEIAHLEEEQLNFDNWVEAAQELTNTLFPSSTETKTVSVEQAATPAENMTAESEDEHYKNLYDDLLITLQKSKETIRSLALRLADIIDDGMDEEQLNALVEELNNSMDAFGELSGIASSSAVEQLEDEVKAIRNAYEQGMNLMEHFENALAQMEQLSTAIEEHASTVEMNRQNYEDGETVDRDKVLSNNKRYTRMIDDEKLLHIALNKELQGAKDIIGDFLAMTRKFQDQSTRIVILQSREKQLNSDLRALKTSQQEALECLKARDIQLGALFKKYHESLETEYNEKIVTLAQEIYNVEQEIHKLDQQESTSASRKQRGELVQKRLALEGQVVEITGGE